MLSVWHAAAEEVLGRPWPTYAGERPAFRAAGVGIAVVPVIAVAWGADAGGTLLAAGATTAAAEVRKFPELLLRGTTGRGEVGRALRPAPPC